MNASIIVRKLRFGDPELKKAFEIRKKVFVEEQSCPAHLEYRDDDVSTHFLAYCDGFPCGAARWRKTSNGIKLERFAVLSSYRGIGVGKELVTAVMADIPADGGPVYLNAQLSALDFYVPFGFSAIGDQFEEAGIMHQQMRFSSGS